MRAWWLRALRPHSTATTLRRQLQVRPRAKAGPDETESRILVAHVEYDGGANAGRHRKGCGEAIRGNSQGCACGHSQATGERGQGECSARAEASGRLGPTGACKGWHPGSPGEGFSANGPSEVRSHCTGKGHGCSC